MRVGNPDPTFSSARDTGVAVKLSAPAPTFAPVSISFTLEASATTPDLIQRILLYDWAAASWVQVDIRPATVADQVVDVPLTNPARFVDPATRTMSAQVRFTPAVPLGTYAGRVDRAAWTVR
jgi:hypothetical protein